MVLVHIQIFPIISQIWWILKANFIDEYGLKQYVRLPTLNMINVDDMLKAKTKHQWHKLNNSKCNLEEKQMNKF
jgi:hypothetical protein